MKITLEFDAIIDIGNGAIVARKGDEVDVPEEAAEMLGVKTQPKAKAKKSTAK